MWSDILNGFIGNLQFSILIYVAIGTIVGTVLGALPGISSISAIALILPFTFTLEPAQGLMLLLAVYMSSEFGGAIPAILLGTPGNSGAACTMLDGYPMTKKGLAREALYLQLFSGTIGGFLGAALLLFLTPPLAQFARLLGPPEIFWVAVAGLTLVASLVGRNILGGLIAVVLGVLLTIPGQDTTTGQLRFTYGNADMVGGFSTVPMLLGLFAVASILVMLEQTTTSVAPLHKRERTIRFVLLRMWKMKFILAWTSMVGALVGLVPGPGSSASAFAAYAEAKRLSKNKAEFGKGAWEGVAAPEAANNAVIGGNLVPLLGIGIPGTAAAAILFGALTVHGIIAGPQLFTQHSELAYGVLTGVFITVVAMLMFGLMTVRYSSLLVKAPTRFIIPSVLAVSIMGAFSFRNNPFDIVVVVVTGAIAFALQKIGVSWIPLSLGIVLGGIIETRFQQSMLIAPTRGGDLFTYWFTRPATVVIALLVVLLIVSGVRQMIASANEAVEVADEDEIWAARTGQQGEVHASEPSSATTQVAVLTDTPSREQANPEGRWMSLRATHIILGVGLLLLAGFVYAEAQKWNERAAQLPLVLVFLLVMLGVATLIFALVPRFAAARSRVYPFVGVRWRTWLVMVVGMVVVAASARTIGFFEPLILTSAVGNYVLNLRLMPPRRALIQAVIFAAVLGVFLYVMFVGVLSVPVTGVFL